MSDRTNLTPAPAPETSQTAAEPERNHAQEWRLSDEIKFLRDIKRLRAKGQTFKQGPAALPDFRDFCTQYLEGLERRALGFKRRAGMDEDDRAAIQACVMRMLNNSQEADKP